MFITLQNRQITAYFVNTNNQEGTHMDQPINTPADGYYGEGDMGGDELDLSFLDDDDTKKSEDE